MSKCPHCKGKGKVVDTATWEERPCSWCMGSGNAQGD